jgi:hypothetical protein
MRQRMRRKALRKAGFSATVPPRALPSLAAIDSSFAQEGSRPHFTSTASGLASGCCQRWRTMRIGCVGAML